MCIWTGGSGLRSLHPTSTLCEVPCVLQLCADMEGRLQRRTTEHRGRTTPPLPLLPPPRLLVSVHSPSWFAHRAVCVFLSADLFGSRNLRLTVSCARSGRRCGRRRCLLVSDGRFKFVGPSGRERRHVLYLRRSRIVRLSRDGLHLTQIVHKVVKVVHSNWLSQVTGHPAR